MATEINGFEIDQYNIHNFRVGKKYHTCPLCSKDRKKKTAECCTTHWDTGIFSCSHCGAWEQMHTYKKRNVVKEYVKPTVKIKESIYSDQFLKYAKDIRGISESTA